MKSAIDEFLAQYSPEIKALSGQLRNFIKETAPGCNETLHTGWKVISYGYGRKFCAIAPHTNWVNLQFHAGASLSDDHELLEGTGKSIRHAKLSKTSDLSADLAELIHQASKLAN
ncbi:MAG: DUF1801 domain-containing protein [Pseudomonadales bacterium]